MAEHTIAGWTERFPLVVDDLRAMPVSSPIIAEGPGLFPDCVLPVIEGPRQAVWLVPTPAFCRAVRLKRNAGSFKNTSDPARAVDNLIARDILLAAHVKHRATALGLTVLEVDGSIPLDGMVAVVERHLAALGTLPRALDSPAPAGQPLPPGWQAYLGHYAYPGHAGHDVAHRDGALVATSRHTGRAYVLAHEVGHTFRVADGPLIGETVQFVVDDAGVPVRLMIAPEEFERQ